MASRMFNPVCLLFKLYSVLVVLSISTNVSAQNKTTLHGVIADEVTSKPINAATILWKNKNIGSITNSEGRFVILLPDSQTSTDSLTFSCLGYQSERVSVNSVITGKEIAIKLNPLVGSLKEVVVRPLTLKQLLDSVIRHNSKMFISQMKLNGYYREFVFTNDKCTEYADAICEYYYNRVSQPDGQLKITASRCKKETKVNEDKNNIEVYKESRLNPNVAFNYTMLSGMVDEYFPEKKLLNYNYRIEQNLVQNTDDLLVTIYPKTDSESGIYKLTFLLTNDFTIKSYHLEIPDELLKRIKGKSMLGIHSEATGLTIDVKYIALDAGIYPSYYSITKCSKIWGKFLGATINQTVLNKSEFLTTELDGAKELKAFLKQDIYKKGNICTNGVSINDALLKNYTIITPSAKDSVAINSLSN
jgi:hypothetical protein